MIRRVAALARRCCLPSPAAATAMEPTDARRRQSRPRPPTTPADRSTAPDRRGRRKRRRSGWRAEERRPPARSRTWSRRAHRLGDAADDLRQPGHRGVRRTPTATARAASRRRRPARSRTRSRSRTVDEAGGPRARSRSPPEAPTTASTSRSSSSPSGAEAPGWIASLLADVPRARTPCTYSIVARDPGTGELGVAVQSHWFSVGSIVAWARPGVGAVATQSMAEPAYGRRLLARLAADERLATRWQAELATDEARALPPGRRRRLRRAAVAVHTRRRLHCRTPATTRATASARRRT